MRISEYLKIGAKLKAARTKAGISQRNMATKLGLSYSTYSNYENGYSEPSMEVIIPFCNIIQIGVEDLFGMKLSDTKNADNSEKCVKDIQNCRAHLTLDIDNRKLAIFISDWSMANEKQVPDCK